MTTGDNRSHWDSLGAQYSENWASVSQQLLSEQETSFLLRHLPRAPGRSVLDVGIGSGRILEKLIAQEQVAAVYGVDISSEMVEVCRERFGNEPKLRGLFVCDVSRQPLPVSGELDFVSAVRMLKYSANWRDMVDKLLAHLAPDGVLVFSMPNENSIKRFARPYAVEYFKTSAKELRTRLERPDLDLLEVTGFSKMPDLLYRRGRHPKVASGLVTLERGLDRAVGPATLARELFVAVRRKG